MDPGVRVLCVEREAAANGEARCGGGAYCDAADGSSSGGNVERGNGRRGGGEREVENERVATTHCGVE